jgi:hypothetical protein
MEEKSKTEMPWLDNVVSLLPKIQSIAKSCDERFQDRCFDVLLAWVVDDLHVGAPKEEPSAGKVETRPSGLVSGKLQQFMDRYKLSEESIGRIVDLTSGEIIAGKLPATTIKEKQQLVAGMIGLSHLVVEGKMVVLKDEFKEVCKKYSADDPGNMHVNLRTAEIEGSKVFNQDENGWTITVPGEKFVADAVMNYHKEGEGSG